MLVGIVFWVLAVVAVTAGVRDKKLPYKWSADGGPVPRDGALQRLQVAHRAWVAIATSAKPASAAHSSTACW